MHDRLAHTAEHAFMGALQRRLGLTLRVHKVEHKESESTAFVAMPEIPLQTILDAQADVNLLIGQGRKVTMRTFESLQAAKAAYPNLRANEERISGAVRVVEIENHDVAACSMEHAGDLSECDFFLVTRVSRSGGEYAIDFAVQSQAKKMAMKVSEKLMKVCDELGANINTVENTAKKAKAENEQLRAGLRRLGGEKLDSIVPARIGNSVLFRAAFSSLDDDQLVEYAGKKTVQADAVVLVANRGPEKARLVFARNEQAGGADFGSLFRRIVGDRGRGGGKPHFVTGVVDNAALDSVMEEIAAELAGNA